MFIKAIEIHYYPGAELFLLYFSGRAVLSLPPRLKRMRRAGLFAPRAGLTSDLALAAGADGALLPVVALQDAVATLGHKVQRKLIILDCRADIR